MPKRSVNGAARWTGFVLAIVATVWIAVVTNRDGYSREEYQQVDGYSKWNDETVKIAKGIPVQDGGRVKPFETRAQFLMLKLHGARKMKFVSGGQEISIGPTEWLLDILFRPEIALKMPTFRVDDSELLEKVGMEVENRRDRYSYLQLEPYLQELGKRAGDLQKEIQAKMQVDPDFKLAGGESDPRALARKIMEYQGMLASNDFSKGVTLDASAETADGEQMNTVSYWVKAMPVLAAALRQQEVPEHVQKLINEVSFRLGRGEGGIEWLPPYEASVVLAPGAEATIHSGEVVKTFKVTCESGKVEMFEGSSTLGSPMVGEGVNYPGAELVVKNTGEESATLKIQGREWMSAGNRLAEVSRGLDITHWERLSNDLKTLEDLCASVEGKESEFAEKLDEWREELVVRAGNLGEKEGKLESEVTYYEKNYFVRGLVWFVFAFVVAAVSWLAPASGWGKWTYRLTWVLGMLGTVYLVWGIVHRCILMERPPVGNLYDTIPFIAGGGVLVLFLLEAVTRRRIALGAAIAVGLLGLFLARAFEGVDAQDHMDPLRAVLRSNFWLSTHVIIITLGYSGGLIAAAMSHVFIYAKAFGLDRNDRSLSRFLTRSVYGLVCFTLFFSLVGTVLGGIWANDSWGRFWGWDPKENGAMLIVLWCLIILHARMGGYLKEWGIHIASVLGAIVVAFSWWGVNLLGTGLHSYGFTEGIGGAVRMFYIFEFVVALGGTGLAIWEKTSRRRKPARKWPEGSEQVPGEQKALG